MKPQAGIAGHSEGFLVPALRAGEPRVAVNIGHLLASGERLTMIIALSGLAGGRRGKPLHKNGFIRCPDRSLGCILKSVLLPFSVRLRCLCGNR